MKKDFDKPIEYVRGFAEFLGCKIDLSKRPLIPRKETEFWTAQAIDIIKKLEIQNSKFEIRCLDIFAGSGCIGIAVLAHAPNVLCDFGDKDPSAIKQIKINLKNNFIKPARYSVARSDVFSKISKKNKYDFILANPPYIPTTRKNKVQKSVLKYEPKTALFAGKDGMKHINKFLKDAKKHLNPAGQIFIEFDGSTSSPRAAQKNKIEKLLKKLKYKSWDFYKDQYGKYRWAKIN